MRGGYMKKVMVLLLWVVLFVSILSVDARSARVVNDSVRQEGSRVLFEFDIEGTEKETDVFLTLTIDGKRYTEKDLHLEGDYGRVKIGKGKRIYWNVLQDFPRGLHTEFEWELRAGSKENSMVIIGPIGVAIQQITPDIASAMGLKESRGALVSSVMPGGPADKAGIKRGDIILEFDRKPIRNVKDLRRALKEAEDKIVILIMIKRMGILLYKAVRLKKISAGYTL